MTKYRTKGEELDAFQWTGEADQTEDPVWICQMLASGEAEFVISKGVMRLVIVNKRHMTMGSAVSGDYVVRSSSGGVFCVAKDKFPKYYAPLSDAEVAQDQNDRLASEVAGAAYQMLGTLADLFMLPEGDPDIARALDYFGGAWANKDVKLLPWTVTELEDVWGRLGYEKEMLEARIKKLTDFVVSEKALALSENDQEVLRSQRKFMIAYSAVLDARLKAEGDRVEREGRPTPSPTAVDPATLEVGRLSGVSMFEGNVNDAPEGKPIPMIAAEHIILPDKLKAPSDPEERLNVVCDCDIDLGLCSKKDAGHVLAWGAPHNAGETYFKAFDQNRAVTDFAKVVAYLDANLTSKDAAWVRLQMGDLHIGWTKE